MMASLASAMTVTENEIPSSISFIGCLATQNRIQFRGFPATNGNSSGALSSSLERMQRPVANSLDLIIGPDLRPVSLIGPILLRRVPMKLGTLYAIDFGAPHAQPRYLIDRFWEQ